MEYLFTYGTLQKEFDIPINKEISQYLKPITTGYFLGKLFEVDEYPGAIQTESDFYPIKGKIFQVTDSKAWQLMDDYEECSDKFPTPHEYKREKIEIRTDEGKRITAWIYLYNYPTSKLTEIKNGDYILFHQKQD